MCVWERGAMRALFNPHPLRPLRTITVAQIQLFKLPKKKNKKKSIEITKCIYLNHMCIYHIFFLLTYRCRLEAQSTDGVHYNRKSGRSRKGGGEGRICTLLLLLLRVPPAVVVVVVIVVLLPRSLPLSLPVSIQLLLFFSSIILFVFILFFLFYTIC